jgi:Uma2 family endonuclease
MVDAVRSYLEVGTVVWIIDPDFQTIAVHQPGQPVQLLAGDQELDGGTYLPGFRVAVARFFEKD